MIKSLNKFKIPTILGLAVITSGIVIGGFLVLREQILTAKAKPDLTPQNITITNIEGQSLTISWQTPAEVVSFVTFGQTTVDEQIIIDDRDQNTPQAHVFHYVTLKNLQPNTTYKYRIISGKLKSEIFEVTTASLATAQNGQKPVIGSVLDENESLNEAIAYLSISGAVTQSALVKNSGNFLIPLSFARKTDMSDVFKPTGEEIAKVTVVSDKGGVSAIFNLQSYQLLPPLKIGQNVDLTVPSDNQIKKFDLNKDGLINSSDYALALKNKVDLNGDGAFDQKDLDLMQKRINQ
ncbi:fibronectin type III domain-containing protein [Candidatus Daviesbacteria bacterium]|nr:fibronectin type III domain-containing protein [Candidatus Daviesbacteria bacterium]